VIVSYECAPLLRRCLRSLQAAPPVGPVQIHVVDNASLDGSAALVRAEFPEVDLVASDRNLGFSAGTNLGIRRGVAPYVLALNPDTELRPGTLDRLLELMEERREIGICGCRLEQEDGSLDHAARRAFPTIVGALGHFSGLGRRTTTAGALSQYRALDVESGPVDAVNGAFMLIRRQALDEVGLFDEGYWMYMEDLDLCYRFAKAGWTTWYEPSVTAMHAKAGSSGAIRGLRLNAAFHYGMARFYRAHYAGGRNPLLNGVVYAGIGVKLAISAVRNAFRRAARR